MTQPRIRTIQRLLKEFHRFYVYLNRKFDKVEYVRAIELQEKTLRLHIHAVLQFNNPQPLITKKIIEDLWGLGICDFQPVNDIWGVLQYITKFKPQHSKRKTHTLPIFLGAQRLYPRVNTSERHLVVIHTRKILFPLTT